MDAQREWFEKDYYALLGVKADATTKEITNAYRKMASQYHPDQNPGNDVAEEHFKEVSARLISICVPQIQFMMQEIAHGHGWDDRGWNPSKGRFDHVRDIKLLE